MKTDAFYLKDFVEKRLTDCINKMSGTKITNLYSIMLREFEKPLIFSVLEAAGWNQTKAAELLGLNRNTLRKKIKDLEISIPGKLK